MVGIDTLAALLEQMGDDNDSSSVFCGCCDDDRDDCFRLLMGSSEESLVVVDATRPVVVDADVPLACGSLSMAFGKPRLVYTFLYNGTL